TFRCSRFRSLGRRLFSQMRPDSLHHHQNELIDQSAPHKLIAGVPSKWAIGLATKIGLIRRLTHYLDCGDFIFYPMPPLYTPPRGLWPARQKRPIANAQTSSEFAEYLGYPWRR